jgi:uncharacterized protein
MMSMTSHRVRVSREDLAAFCRQHHIRWLALFGSVLRPDFRPDSDVDVLVEFEPGHVPGLRFIGLQEDLSRLFGRPVDLVTPKFLNPRIRNEVLQNAEVQFEQP